MTTHLQLILLCESLRCSTCRRVTNKAHDADDRPMLTEYLRYFIHAVAVFREDYHPSASFCVVSMLLLEVDKVFEDDLLEFCQLRMSDGQ